MSFVDRVDGVGDQDAPSCRAHLVLVGRVLDHADVILAVRPLELVGDPLDEVEVRLAGEPRRHVRLAGFAGDRIERVGARATPVDVERVAAVWHLHDHAVAGGGDARPSTLLGGFLHVGGQDGRTDDGGEAEHSENGQQNLLVLRQFHD